MSDTQASRVGTMFGPYRLKRLLGRGGMGEVYEAEHTVKEWTVALKLMSDTFSRDPVFRKRMKHEARNAGGLQEPHVVPIHEYGEIDGTMFMEMRLIEGTDLDTLLKRFGPLTPPRAVAIITQIASALDAAHAAKIVHRDVKPPNVLVTHDDFAYLCDFGIAMAPKDEKLTQLGTAVGTWKYMAPERFSTDEPDYRVDIYALACVLYECLTGSPPYRTDSVAVLAAHRLDPIPQPSTVRPGIPKAFDAVIARGMAKKPEDRYASAGDLALAAREALSDRDQDSAATILRRSQEAAPPANTQPDRTWTPDSGPTTPYYQPNNANWATPRPPQNPLHQFAGATPWNQPPPKGKRNPWPIVAGIAGGLVVLLVAAIGISTALHHNVNNNDNNAQPTTTTSTTTSIASTTTTTTPPSPSDDLQGKLLSMLPAGYPSGTCTPTAPKPNSIWVSAVAMVDCGQNTLQGGPSHGVYLLFAGPAALKKAFDDDIAEVQQANCPDGAQSPHDWQYSKTPTVTAGQVACGTYKDHPNLVWSTQSKLMLADVFGDSAAMGDLYTWWGKFG